MITKIYIPTRLQTDSLVAIFLLKHYGEEKFPGIEKAEIQIVSKLEKEETEENLKSKGVIAVDIGGGIFDHHIIKDKKVTTTSLVAEHLGVNEGPEFEMLFSMVERCEFFGKATISTDAIDKAFGFTGLLSNLNTYKENNPKEIYKILEPILEAHINEQKIRTVDLPKIFKEKLSKEEADVFSVKQNGKNVKVAMIKTDNVSMSGYLRSNKGGNHGIVILGLETGHINVITKSILKIDITNLVALVRRCEALLAGKDVTSDMKILSQSGRIEEIPEWYYDPATNSLQNGGINPSGVKPTKINWEQFRKLIEVAFSNDFQ